MCDTFLTGQSSRLGEGRADAEARDLTDRVHDAIIRDVARRYDRASAFRFADLPAAAQTVIADVAIQFGPNLRRWTPDFWRQVTSGEWQAALDELKDFEDRFDMRRLAEAAQLSRAIQAGTLPRAPSILLRRE